MISHAQTHTLMFRKLLIGSAIVGTAAVATGVAIEYQPDLRKRVVASQSQIPNLLFPVLGNNFKQEFLQHHVDITLKSPENVNSEQSLEINFKREFLLQYINGILKSPVNLKFDQVLQNMNEVLGSSGCTSFEGLSKSINISTLLAIALNLDFNIMDFIPVEKQTPALVDHCVDIGLVGRCDILTDKLKEFLIKNTNAINYVTINCVREFIKVNDDINIFGSFTMRDRQLWYYPGDEYVMNKASKEHLLNNPNDINILKGPHQIKFLESLQDNQLQQFKSCINYSSLPQDLKLKFM